MPIAGGSWAASFSRLRIACFRVISNDDTHITEASQYIFSIKCFWKLVLKPDRRSLRGDRGSIRPTATSRLYGNKQLGCGILSGKLARASNEAVMCGKVAFLGGFDYFTASHGRGSEACAATSRHSGRVETRPAGKIARPTRMQTHHVVSK
jgi:hypothetical protein